MQPEPVGAAKVLRCKIFMITYKKHLFRYVGTGVFFLSKADKTSLLKPFGAFGRYQMFD
jgi:hypothetical protein